MYLQQTKFVSRATGGPQYFLYDEPPAVKQFLRDKRTSPVILQTPYGMAASPFIGVHKDWKIDPDGDVVPANAQHNRIQQGEASESIGEAIRWWYGIRQRGDFERIDIDVQIHPDGHFIIAPTSVTLRGKTRAISLRRPHRPLSFHRHLQSPLWKDQIEAIKSKSPEDLLWAGRQIQRVAEVHLLRLTANISEADLLRTAGAFSVLGVQLGPYLLDGYDCQETVFQFLNFPEYKCPVEIKKQSFGFTYQIREYNPLPRAVVLCITHDLENLPDDIDVVELSTFGKYLGERCGEANP
jgi:hypothetical protein